MVMPDGKMIAVADTEGEEQLIADIEVSRSVPADIPFPWRSIGLITPVIIIEYLLCKAVIAGKIILKIFSR